MPDVETMQTLSWGWALWLYAVNAAAIFVFYGSVELFWYVKRKQGTRFKYNGKFPAEQPSDVFWFKSQNIDNFLRSFFISIPLWTLVEVLFLWAFANSLGRLAAVGDALALAGRAGADQPGDPRGALLLHPPADPHADPLQMDPFGSPQLGQPVALVVAVDAPGGGSSITPSPSGT